MAWLGPAAVLCQRGASVWLHAQGDIKKVAASKVKPYELIDTGSGDKEEEEVSSNDLNDVKSCGHRDYESDNKSSHKENVASCGDSGK